MSNNDQEEILEFLAQQWIPVRQMLRTMSRGDSLTDDIFTNCIVREFRIPNRLLPALTKIVKESCRYHDVVHTETLRKKVDDYRRMKEEREEIEKVMNDQQTNNFGGQSHYFAIHQNNAQQQQSYRPQSSSLQRQIYQPPRLQPDSLTQEQMDLLHFQAQKSAQRSADRFNEFFDESKDPKLKNPPLPKTEAQKARERLMGKVCECENPISSSSSRGLPAVSSSQNNQQSRKNGLIDNNNNNDQQQQSRSLLLEVSPRVQQQQQQRPQTASYPLANKHTQTPPRQNNAASYKQQTAAAADQQQQQHQHASVAAASAAASGKNSTLSHRGCTPKVDLGTRREALRVAFLKATNGVSVVNKQHFREALDTITPWDLTDDEFSELYQNCKQPATGKVHVDDFCHKFINEYVQNSSSFAVSMRPCFAPITKSPRYFHHPNLSLSRTGGSNGASNNNVIIEQRSSGNSDVLGRSSIVAKAQREKEERERQARRVVRLTRSSELRKEVGALFRKTIDSYDGYIQCGIIPQSPSYSNSRSGSATGSRPTSARNRMASIGSAGVVNLATVHLPEPPLGTHKFYPINTRIEADATTLGNHPSPRVVNHRN